MRARARALPLASGMVRFRPPCTDLPHPAAARARPFLYNRSIHNHSYRSETLVLCRCAGCDGDGLRMQLDHRSEQRHLDLHRNLRRRRAALRGDSPATHTADCDFLRLVATDLRGEGGGVGGSVTS